MFIQFLCIPYVYTSDQLDHDTLTASYVWGTIDYPGQYADKFMLLICGGLPWQVGKNMT